MSRFTCTKIITLSLVFSVLASASQPGSIGGITAFPVGPRTSPFPKELGHQSNGEFGGQNPDPLHSSHAPVDRKKPDPVDLANGEFFFSERDALFPGIAGLPVEIWRFYGSQTIYDGYLGQKWDSPIFMRISDTGSGSDVGFYNGECRKDIFSFAGTDPTTGISSYATPPGFFYKLTKTTPSSGQSSFALVSAQGMTFNFEFNKNGGGLAWYRLKEILEPNGNKVQFNYLVGGTLNQIVDTTGAIFSFTYFTSGVNNGRVKQISHPSGFQINYAYDGQGNLTTATTAPTTDYPQGSTTTFGYDGSSRLVSVQEPGESEPYLVNHYDSQSRVDSQQLGEANQTISIDYSSYPLVTVFDRMGLQTDHLVDQGTHQILQSTAYDSDILGQTYTTSYEYNQDYLRTREIKPNQQTLVWTYDTNNPDPRAHNNMIKFEQKADPQAASGIFRTWTFTPDFNKVATEMSPRANALTGGVLVPQLATRYTYDPKGNLWVVTFPDTADWSGPQIIQLGFIYDSLGRVTTRIDPKGSQTIYQYSPTPKRPFPDVEIEDFGGINRITHRFYDSANNLTKIQKACACSGGSQETSYFYNARGEVYEMREEIDAVTERVTKFSYDSSGHLLSRKRQDDSPVGDGWAETRYVYNLLHQPISITQDVDVSNHTTTNYSYDLNDRLSQTNYPEGVSVRFQYKDRDLLKEVRFVGNSSDPNDDSVESFQYDDNGRVIQVNRPLSNPEFANWDSYDRLFQETDASGNEILNVFDEDGNLLIAQILDSSNHLQDEVHFNWDFHNRLTAFEKRAKTSAGTNLGNGDGFLTQLFNYDKNSRLVGTLNEDGSLLSRSYDALGRVLSTRDSMTPANGFDFEYQTSGLLNKVWSVEGNQLTGLTETNLVANIISYDFEGKILEAQDALGHSSKFEWTLGGSLKAKVDRNGHRTESLFDEMGRVINLRRILGASGLPTANDVVTDYSYDGNSNLSQAIARNLPFGPDQGTTYFYNAYGLLKSVTFANNTVESFEYDIARRLKKKTDPNGSVSTLTYDLTGQMRDLGIQRGPGVSGTTFKHFDYDAMGRTTRAENDGFIVNRIYNSLDRIELEAVQSKTSSFSSTVQGNYDSLGRLNKLHYPQETFSNPDYGIFSFDGIDRLTEVRKQEGSTLRSVLQYFFVGSRPLRELRPNAETLRGYDALGRLNSILHKKLNGPSIASVSIGYDNLENTKDVYRTFFNDQGNPLSINKYDGGAHYDYDAADRLVASYSGLSAQDLIAGNLGNALLQTAYSYDRNGNRTSVQTADGSGSSFVQYVSDLINEYLTVGGVDNQFDLNGNSKSIAQDAQMVFDYLNKPVAIIENGNTATISYDAFGRRIETSSPQQDEILTYWGIHPIEQRLIGAGPPIIREFAYGGTIDEMLEMRDLSSGINFQNYLDRLGSSVVLTGLNGQIAESYRYSDFGERIGASITSGALLSGPASPLGNPIAFQGRWTVDKSEKRLDFRNRFYLPQWGRFAQPDPLGFPDGRNRYHFGNNNPNRSDPLGLFDQGQPNAPGGQQNHPSITQDAGGGSMDPGDLTTVKWSDWNQDNEPNVAGVGSDNNPNFHALGLTEEEEEVRLRELMSTALLDCDLIQLGWAMHFVQDMIAHRRFDGSMYGRRWGHGAQTGTSWLGSFNPDGPGNLRNDDSALRLWRRDVAVDRSRVLISEWIDFCGNNPKSGSFFERYDGGRNTSVYTVGPSDGEKKTVNTIGPTDGGKKGVNTIGPSGGIRGNHPGNPGPVGPPPAGPTSGSSGSNSHPSGPVTPGPSGPSSPPGPPAPKPSGGSYQGPYSPGPSAPSSPPGPLPGPTPPTAPGGPGPRTLGPGGRWINTDKCVFVF